MVFGGILTSVFSRSARDEYKVSPDTFLVSLEWRV